jgi:DNA-directed RNA polymerase subunit RPC12/RpoP
MNCTRCGKELENRFRMGSPVKEYRCDDCRITITITHDSELVPDDPITAKE